MRRHTRPEPPASVPARTLAEIRGDNESPSPADLPVGSRENTRMTNRHNSINQKPSAAEMLTRQIAAAQRKPENLDDSFAQAIGRKLESRGIARVPGLPGNLPEESTWRTVPGVRPRKPSGYKRMGSPAQGRGGSPERTADHGGDSPGDIAKASIISNAPSAEWCRGTPCCAGRRARNR